MMAPHRQYTTADFAHIAATEFADYGFHLTQQWRNCKHIAEREYRNAYILWAMRRFGDVDVAREFLDYAMPDMFDPVCDINGLRMSQLKAMDKEQMTERVRTDVRNLAIEARCDIKTAWDKLERLMPDLHDYRPVTDEEKQKWYNI